LRGEPATRRSDVYSAGAVLDELACGLRPTQPQMERTPLAGRAPAVPAALASIVDRCLSAEPSRRYASAEELLTALERLVPGGRALSLPDENPYRGLSTFEAEHRSLFFGRDAEVRAVFERLRREHIVIVVGDSGVGKSSLCRAGVLPLVDELGLD